MTRSASVSSFGSEFNDFLFAPVGEDRNGMLLTVLSVLARRNVDPWREAAKLAQLPVGTATDQLASVIAELPEGPSVRPDPATMAARLIALLPRWVGSKAQSREPAAPDAGGKMKTRTIVFVVAMVLLMGAQYFMEHRQPAAEGYTPSASISGAVSPPSGPRP